MDEYLIHYNHNHDNLGRFARSVGVRKYENFDGSYTRAGMKRYRDSEEQYERANERYHAEKKKYKSGESSKYALTNARIARNAAKKHMKKDYKHLKQDKLADQGKELYSKNVRITRNENRRAMVATAATIGGYASLRLIDSGKQVYFNGMGTMPLNVFAATTIATGAIAVDTVLSAKNNYQNKRLRAYYSHTSNY